ncbi:four-carbon acid sugar kinase family protein [Candidatus Gracilibacteria bacterium]|nr:four-carbon acid sugar kinase family protein [Candidatus Gracilibacteria bacterium]
MARTTSASLERRSCGGHQGLATPFCRHCGAACSCNYGGYAQATRARWYKKFDSTLRGQLGAEISVMLEVLAKEHAIIAPAFPAQGRGLRDGILVAEQTTGALHLPTLLAGYGPLTAFGLATVRQGSERLAHKLRQVAAQARLLVFDALTDADLAVVAAAADRALPHAYSAGARA